LLLLGPAERRSWTGIFLQFDVVNATIYGQKTAPPIKVKSLLFRWLQVELNFGLFDVKHGK
jgi:hypothetical protein